GFFAARAGCVHLRCLVVCAENVVHVEAIELCRYRCVGSSRDRERSMISGLVLRGGGVSGRAAPRSPRAAPSTTRGPTVSAAAASSRESGPVALGPVVPCVDRLANGPCHREAETSSPGIAKAFACFGRGRVVGAPVDRLWPQMCAR